MRVKLDYKRVKSDYMKERLDYMKERLVNRWDWLASIEAMLENTVDS